MTIAILIDSWLPFYGGGQKNVLDLKKFLIARGIQVKIFHGAGGGIILRIFWLIYVIPQVIFYHFFIKKIDIFDARPFLAGLPAKILSLFLGIPVIYTVNGCASLDEGKKDLKAGLEKFLLTRILYSQEITDSPHFLKYKNINKNIQIIPNGVNLGSFNNVFYQKSDNFTLISVGRLTKIKGYIYLLQAIKEVVKKYPKIKLNIIGQGEEEKKLKDFVKKNNLTKTIFFLGQLTGSKLIKHYKTAKVFVLASVAEGMPNTILEAWAAKLAVIATRVGALPTIINASNGYLVDKKNYQALTQTIIKARENKNLKQLGINGYKLVKNNYNLDNYLNAYLKIYQKYV